jgi:hypothetical protein
LALRQAHLSATSAGLSPGSADSPNQTDSSILLACTSNSIPTERSKPFLRGDSEARTMDRIVLNIVYARASIRSKANLAPSFISPDTSTTFISPMFSRVCSRFAKFILNILGQSE